MKLQRIGFEMKTSKLITAAFLAVSVLGFGNYAQAALISCPSSFTTDPTAKVEDATGTTTAASACQYVSPPDPSTVASISNINTIGFFGTTTWTLNGANGQVDPANDLAGTWSITGADFANFDYIIVFKDGANTNLVAFLFNELFSNGVWSSPFTDPPFDVNNPKDVSHYTIAQRAAGEPPCDPATQDCGPRELPEPGGLALISLGLFGAALASKRGRRRSQRRP